MRRVTEVMWTTDITVEGDQDPLGHLHHQPGHRELRYLSYDHSSYRRDHTRVDKVSHKKKYRNIMAIDLQTNIFHIKLALDICNIYARV